MVTAKRRVEVFTAGCPLCEEAVGLVRSLACPSCEVQVYDLREGCATDECRDKARGYVRGHLGPGCRGERILAGLL